MTDNTETITLALPSKTELDRMAVQFLDGAKALEITDDAMYEAAGAELSSIKSRIKDLETKRKEITTPMDQAKKRIMDLFRGPLDVLTQAKTVVERGMASYYQEQERIRREAERKAREEAAKIQEKLRREAERKAAKLEDKGQADEARALREQAPVVVPAAAPPPPKAAGTHTRESWTAEVVDKMALIKAVAEGRANHMLIEPNQSALNKQAAALKGALDIPGVEPRRQLSVVSRC
jgi:vacuolar-type H+-ATPase subunit H